ncbi:MAG: caspase family protein [Treponema sp.]|nr:caspase family protein [Treponema sp.]
MKKLTSIVAAMTLALTSLFAQVKSDTPRYALVIGNQTYEQSALKNPVADAKMMKESLEKCGFEVTLALDLDLTKLRKTIADYAEKVSESGSNSISFFYYSGHGVQLDGKNYLVPVDDKEITTAFKAKSLCYKIDEVFSLVPSKTQIVVLDACRNNPFSSTKEVFQKGLSRIANPKGVTNFIAFFSTSDGATADDGSGKNSLFTEKLSFHIENDFNTPISTVFNSVASDVKEATSGRQTPLVTGTGMNLELMNADIAAAKIKKLENAIKNSKSSKSAAAKFSDSEMKLKEAEIAMLQERKKEAEKDAKVKKEQKERADAIQKKNQKEMERMQKEAAAQRKKFQSQKATEKSSLQFIGEIEDNKEALQKIRLSAADKIYAADNATQKKTNSKIDEVNNRPLKVTEKDAKGKINSETKKRRKAEIKVFEDENKVEKQKNYDTFYDKIKDEETERVNAMNADIQTLKTAVYTASSFIDEAEFTVSEYDGAKNQWIVTVNSNILNRKDLFYTTIAIPYKELCTQVIGKKYVEPKKMDYDAFEQYSDDIDTYNLAFRGENPPLLVEVDYKVSPASGASTYEFSAKEVRVKFMKDGENPLLNKKSFSSKGKLVWEQKQTEIKTVTGILKEYEKRDAAEEKARQKALKNK